MSTSLPEIRINFSWLFYTDISEQICKLNKWNIATVEECEQWTNEYRAAWAQKEKIVLEAMQEIIGLRFYKSVIDVTTAPGVIPKSEPLLMNFMDTPEGFVDTLTHELLHVLLTDNTILSIYGNYRDKSLKDHWMELFGFEDDFNALVHIPVHAIQKKIWLDVLGDSDGPKRDLEYMKKLGADSYVKSWEYVEKNGHEEIIQKLKDSYAAIEKSLEKKS